MSSYAPASMFMRGRAHNINTNPRNIPNDRRFGDNQGRPVREQRISRSLHAGGMHTGRLDGWPNQGRDQSDDLFTTKDVLGELDMHCVPEYQVQTRQYLETTHEWRNFFFKLGGGVLRWYDDPDDDEVDSITLMNVVKISTSSDQDNMLAVTTAPMDGEASWVYFLRAKSRDERNRWLHSFHLCVAWLVNILKRRQEISSGENFQATGRSHTSFRHVGHRPQALQSQPLQSLPELATSPQAISDSSDDDSMPASHLPRQMQRTMFQRQLTVVNGDGHAANQSSPEGAQEDELRNAFDGLDGSDDGDLFGGMEMGSDGSSRSRSVSRVN